MRVLLLNQYYWPDLAATAQILTDLAEGLASRGHDVTVLCSRRSYIGNGARLPRKEARNGVTIFRLPALGGGKSAGFVRRVADLLTFYAAATCKCVFTSGVDVVVTLTTPPMIGLLGRLMQRLKGVRHIHWCMDMYPDLFVANRVIKEARLLHRLFARAVGAYVGHCDAVLVLGRHMRSRMLSYGPRPERVRILPLWANGQEVRPVPREGNWFISKHGLEGKFVVLYSGNIGAVETLDTVVEACERLLRDKDVLFLFIGGHADQARLKARVEARGLTNFRFLPYQDRDDLAYSLSAGHVHIVYFMPGKEGMKVPCKIYGILAAGGPVVYVGPQRTEVADIVAQRKVGVAVEDGDVDAFVNAIRSFRDSPSLLREVSHRSRATFEEQYDADVILDRFDRLLRSISRDSKAPAELRLGSAGGVE